METIRFDRRVALVTGAGRGLGRSYALELASRGAKVVVNDLGCSVFGTSTDDSVAQSVVGEIEASGGTAVANTADVSDPDGARSIVEDAVKNFGRIDAVVCNAGIANRIPFSEITPAQYARIDAVNHLGTAYVAMAAWPHFFKQNYGRLIVTSSVAGTWGRPALSAYSASKAAVLGLARTLAFETGDTNIKVNTVLPMVASRMTEDRIKSDLGKRLGRAELTSALVTVLCHEDCRVSGQIFQTFAGQYLPLRFYESPGLQLDPRGNISAEQLLNQFDKICSMTELRTFNHPSETAKIRFDELALTIGGDAYEFLKEISGNVPADAPTKVI